MKSSAVLMLLDVDHFKQINDAWGHRAGDDVIKVIGSALRESLPADDLAGRYGGDEFAVLLAEGGAAGARAFHARLRRRLDAAAAAAGIAGPLPPISLSVGAACRNIQDTHVADWLARADTALYQVKRTGRGSLFVLEEEVNALSVHARPAS
jgi:diguanylate cyclase